MKKAIFILLSLIVAVSCTEEKRQEFEFSGGSITMALDYEPTTYIPRNVLDYYSAKVLDQIAEGLVGFEPTTLKIEPRLVTGWTKSDDGKKYTFTFRFFI